MVEIGKGICEAGADPMFVVKGDGLVDSSVGDGVTVSQVLCDDTGARFVFLRNVVAIGIFSCGGGVRGF